MKKVLLLLLAAGAVAVVALVRGPAPQAGQASSHREAPLISDDPTADNTDLYAFRSPDKPDTVTIIANWIPGEDPAAGPNYYTFSPTARYYIYIDKDGDAKPDVTYRFEFKRADGQFFLGNTQQDFTVTRITGKNQNQEQVVATGTTPPDNIGPKSTPNYRTLAAKGVYPLQGGGQIFAGQRDDAFFGDVGAIFDLLNLRKFPPNLGGGKDFLAGYAVHGIALQLPIADLDNNTNHTIGVWAATQRPVVTVRTVPKKVKVKAVVNGKRVTKTKIVKQTVASHAWVQISRLGNPLVNEVVIPTTLKDKWNTTEPADDKQFEQYYTSPILAAVMNTLFPGVINAPEHNRDDLVAVLLTGVPSLNFTGTTEADMLRLNMSIPVSAHPNRLGVFGGDNQGYPNGRRLEDDVIDIAEQAVAGKLKQNPVADVLADGVNDNDVPNLSFFPYEADPFSGFDNTKGLQKP
ncbi:MAG TPA: DUF4331 domain-containing protein [Gaiellaceae bacterium]